MSASLIIGIDPTSKSYPPSLSNLNSPPQKSLLSIIESNGQLSQKADSISSPIKLSKKAPSKVLEEFSESLPDLASKIDKLEKPLQFEDLFCMLFASYFNGRWSLYEVHNIIKQINRLPNSLQTQDICVILFKLFTSKSYEKKYVEKFIDQIIKLPESLQTTELCLMLFNLYKLSWGENHTQNFVDQINRLPKSLQNTDLCKTLFELAKSGHTMNYFQTERAILLMPKDFLTPEIITALFNAKFNAEYVADAILLTPKHLLTQQNLKKLTEAGNEAVQEALALQEIDEQEKLEKRDLRENHSKLSSYIGSRPGHDGKGSFNTFKIKEEFFPPTAANIEEKKSREQAVSNAQNALFPAPEGPNYYAKDRTRRISSKGMNRVAEVILGEEDSSSFTLEKYKRAEARLTSQSKTQDLDGRHAGRRLDTLKRCFDQWWHHELGYSYSKKDGYWTVPDVEALQYGLNKLDIPITVETVEEIVPDREYLELSLKGIVVGHYAHDHWIHMVPQLEQYFEDPEFYVQARNEMRLSIKSILSVLDFHEKKSEEDKMLHQFFITFLSAFMDLNTAGNNLKTPLIFSDVFRGFANYFGKQYPKEWTERDFFNNKFVPFVNDLVSRLDDPKAIDFFRRVVC